MDYYSSDEAAPSEAQGEVPEEKGKENESEQTTALIPKALLAGKDFKVGDEVIFKITHMYEDEVEIEYATEEKKDEKPKSTMDEADANMEKMAKPMEGY